MKSINQVTILCLIITICACINVAAQTTEPPVNWFDDFLGVEIHPGYAKSTSGSGGIDVTSSIGGVVVLAATANEIGDARLRFGGDSSTAPVDVCNFSATKNMVYKARVFLNRATDIQATVGLIGLNGPGQVIAATYTAEPGDTNASWGFEVNNGTNHMAISTGFQHTPGSWFTVKIVTEWGDVPSARLYINDETEPLATVTGESVPSTGLCPEFRVWNKPLQSGWSQPSLYIDYLSVTQDR